FCVSRFAVGEDVTVPGTIASSFFVPVGFAALLSANGAAVVMTLLRFLFFFRFLFLPLRACAFASCASGFGGSFFMNPPKPLSMLLISLLLKLTSRDIT